MKSRIGGVLVLTAISLLATTGSALATSSGGTVVVGGTKIFTAGGTTGPGVLTGGNTLRITYECHAAGAGTSNVTIPTTNPDDPAQHGCSLWQDQTLDPNPNVHNWVEVGFAQGSSAPGEANVVATADVITTGGKDLRTCWFASGDFIIGGAEATAEGCDDGTSGASFATPHTWTP